MNIVILKRVVVKCITNAKTGKKKRLERYIYIWKTKEQH